MIYYHHRLYIPASSRAPILSQVVHDTHIGVHQTLKKCTMSVWWPNMARDAYSFVADYDKCNKLRFRGTPSTGTWQESQSWERVHVDWATITPLLEIFLLLISCSSWIEAIPCKDQSTATVHRSLLEIFSRFSVPKTLVSDNGAEFVALNQWLSKMNCRQVGDSCLQTIIKWHCRACCLNHQTGHRWIHV